MFDTMVTRFKAYWRLTTGIVFIIVILIGVMIVSTDIYDIDPTNRVYEYVESLRPVIIIEDVQPKIGSRPENLYARRHTRSNRNSRRSRRARASANSSRRHDLNNPIRVDHYTVLNPICKLLFPSSLMLLFHHKTGTVLARKFHATIRDYCGILFEDQWKRTSHNWLMYSHFRESDESQHTLNPDRVLIHFWRDPVLTIVSGFAYHITCTELWASWNLYREKLRIAGSFFNYNTDPFALYDAYRNVTWPFDVHKEPPTWRNRLTKEQEEVIKVFTGNRDYHGGPGSMRNLYLYYMNDVTNHISLKEYGDYYGFNIDFDDTMIHKQYNIFREDKLKDLNFAVYKSINQWYGKMFASEETLKYGLYFEMMRFLFVVYPEIYYYHFDLVTQPEYELKMETWHSDFERNMNVMLDALNLIDSKENREILKQNNYTDMDIQRQRDEVEERLKLQDVTRVNHQRDNGIETIERHEDRCRRCKIAKHTNEVLDRREMEMANVAYGGEDMEERRPRDRSRRPRERSSRYRQSRTPHVRRLKSHRAVRAAAREIRRHAIREDHIHTARNNTKYVHELLTLDMQICLLLKHVTELIDYGWQYSAYC
eukprot:255208_1